MQIDVRVTQLLCSRLCHDLVGAVGAVNTGVEFLTDGGGDAAEALDLLSKSADRLTRRLNFFRGALGFGGGRQGPLTLDEARELAHGWYKDAKPKLHWTPTMTMAGDDGVLKVPGIKMLMLMTLLAEESLARGGDVEAHVVQLEEGLGVAVRATGAGAGLAEEVAAGLNPSCPPDTLTPRNVHAHWAQGIAQSQGAFLEAETTLDEVRFAALLP
ncbi:MAG: histidine phosphotransferase family protein [Rhodospirillaceae bacterium]